jgi:hypothetical protein
MINKLEETGLLFKYIISIIPMASVGFAKLVGTRAH